MTLGDVRKHLKNNNSIIAKYLSLNRATVTKYSDEDVVILDGVIYKRHGRISSPLEEFGPTANYDREKYLSKAQLLFSETGFFEDTARILSARTHDYEQWLEQLHQWRAHGKLTK